MQSIYLDHNASTPLYNEAFEAMRPYLTMEIGNASSLHQAGQRARKAIEDARARMASFIGADDPSEIIFTSGGTEADNMALKGIWAVSQNKGKRVISSPMEHAAVRQVLRQMAGEHLIDLVLAPVSSSGVLNANDIQPLLTDDTILVSVMAANNEVGTVQPLSDIARLCRQKQIPFFSDGVQAAGKMPIRVNDMGVDLFSLSAHKFGGPKGAGILYIRKGTRMVSLIQGGRQEKNWRGGTENVAGIVGMAKAAEIAQQNLERDIAKLKNLRDTFENEILSKIPQSRRNGDLKKRIPNTSNMCFEFTDSSAMVAALDLQGVACSNGSACTAGSPEPSHVLLAMGLPQELAHASLRFSLGHTTTQDDIKKACRILIETVQKQRETNPLWEERQRHLK